LSGCENRDILELTIEAGSSVIYYEAVTERKNHMSRMFGDTVFAIGAVAFVYFAVNLIFRPRKKEKMIAAVPETA
jgi:hypothetical protein